MLQKIWKVACVLLNSISLSISFFLSCPALPTAQASSRRNKMLEQSNVGNNHASKAELVSYGGTWYRVPFWGQHFSYYLFSMKYWLYDFFHPPL